MRFLFVGKDTVVSEALKEQAIQKISKLEKFIPEQTEIFITFTVTKLENKVEVTIPIKKNILRAEAREKDMYVALDQVVDILHTQIVRYKGRLKNKSRKDNIFKDETLNNLDNVNDKYNSVDIIKTKRFAIKPIDPEEAVMEMELLNHSFYVFRNIENEEVNVVYRRNDGSYGLIEPEF